MTEQTSRDAGAPHAVGAQQSSADSQPVDDRCADPLRRLQQVVALLRRHCPWTRGLTHQNLVEYLVEEAYETLEEIEAGRVDDSLRRELGDVLFQVVLHARLGEERGSFDLDGVAEAITAKLVRRSPHVFAPSGELAVDEQPDLEEIQRAWTRIKAAEKAAEKADEPIEGPVDEQAGPGPSADRGELAAVVDSLPARMPALARAAKIVDRLEHRGGAAPSSPEAAPSLRASSPLIAADEDALGELLFTVVREARRRDQDPERALRRHLTTLAQGRVGPGTSRHQ